MTAIAATDSLDMTTGSILLLGQVHIGIQVMKVDGHEFKAGVDAVLDGKVFATDGMVQAKGMPRHNIRLQNTAFLLAIVGQPVALTIALVHILSSGITFLFMEGGHPQLLVCPGHALPTDRIGVVEHSCRVNRLQLETYGVPGVVRLFGIHKLPITLRLRIARESTFRFQRLFLNIKRVSERIRFRVCGFCHRITLHNGIFVTIYRHVETSTKVVLMNITHYTRAHFGAILARFTGLTRNCVDNSGGFHLKLNHAIQIKVPITPVLVVANRGDARDDETTGTADLGTIGAKVPVFPQNSVLVVHKSIRKWLAHVVNTPKWYLS